MKDLDVKKLVVLIVFVVFLIGGFFLIRYFNKNGKNSENDLKVVEELTDKYITSLTQGYSTIYSGIDILYSKDEMNLDYIEYGAIVNTAIKYAQNNGANLSVASNIVNGIKANSLYKDLDDYVAYNGKEINKVILKLFGETTIPNNMVNKANFLYDVIYDKDNEVYFLKRNNNIIDYSDSSYFMDYRVVSKEKVKDNYNITIAVGYVYNDNSSITYYKDPQTTVEVGNTYNEFPESKINEFDQFTLTFKKTDEGNLIFDSIKKVN